MSSVTKCTAYSGNHIDQGQEKQQGQPDSWPERACGNPLWSRCGLDELNGGSSYKGFVSHSRRLIRKMYCCVYIVLVFMSSLQCGLSASIRNPLGKCHVLTLAYWAVVA